MLFFSQVGSTDEEFRQVNVEEDSDGDHCYSTEWETSSNEEDEEEDLEERVS
jgi:hypothetical protein